MSFQTADAASISHLHRARALRGLIEREADNTESSGTVPAEIIQAFRDAKLFWVLCPKELGGAGESVLTYFDTIEEVARSDGSTGWTLMANSTATTVAATQCSDEHVKRMFGGPRLPIMALAFAPSGRCTEKDGKLRGGGHFGFGSGISHADWVSGGLMMQSDGQPQMLEGGMPKVVGAFVPRDTIKLHGNWDVTGLRGTGSFDFEIPETDIDPSWTFNQYFSEPKRGGAVSAIGTYAYACLGHTAVVFGMARRALEEAARMASVRKRLGAPGTISESPLFQADFMKFEAMFQGARAHVVDVYRDAEETAKSGTPVTKVQQARMRQAATRGHTVAKEVVQFAFSAGASGSLRNPSVLGRLLRDVSVAAQHIIVDPSSMTEAAPEVIAYWAGAEG
jgi:alkylation response protein AidB-like acyl-CoA dehydrogenase